VGQSRIVSYEKRKEIGIERRALSCGLLRGGEKQGAPDFNHATSFRSALGGRKREKEKKRSAQGRSEKTPHLWGVWRKGGRVEKNTVKRREKSRGRIKPDREKIVKDRSLVPKEKKARRVGNLTSKEKPRSTNGRRGDVQRLDPCSITARGKEKTKTQTEKDE